MPKIVGVCLSWPRPSLAQVLGCWARQTYPAELYVYTEQRGGTLGEKRNAAVAGAIRDGGLSDDDWLVVVDDDDHYAPWHVETIAAAVQAHPSAGLIAPPCYLTTDREGAPYVAPLTRGAAPHVTVIDPGTGPHAGDAIRVGAWAACGGYPHAHPEDTPLMNAIRERFGVHYSDRASYLHRQDRGDHRAQGALQPPIVCPDVPPPDRHYSAQQRDWDARLALL